MAKRASIRLARRHVPAPDDVCAGCLDRVRRGDLTAIRVLIDRLADIDHPMAGPLQAVFQRYLDGVAYVNDPARDFNRHRKTRWEMTAVWGRWLYHQVRRAFGRDWNTPPLRTFVIRNR